ncbi:MAG: fibronectin type III domain-containing protein [bacterium]
MKTTFQGKFSRKILHVIRGRKYRLSRNSVYLPCLWLLPLLITRTVNLTWDANPDSDLIGYRIYYGTASKLYDEEIFVGKVTSHLIPNLLEGQKYFFSLTALDSAGNESAFADEISIEIPHEKVEPVEDTTRVTNSLVYNFPNPFKPNLERTRIRYELSRPQNVTIDIFNVNNEPVKTLVKNKLKRAGEHTEDVWDGKNSKGEVVAIGVYFCRIVTEEKQKFIKIAVTR